MNSESEKKLSMDELLEKNRPAPTAKLTVPESTPPPEAHPTKEEWEEMMDYLYTLGYHAEKQASYLKKVSELLERFPTQTQMDELLKTVKHLEQMSEQAGKPKEKHFSLPGIRLRLPHLDGPTIVVLLMAMAALLLLSWGLDTVWSSLSLLNL